MNNFEYYLNQYKQAHKKNNMFPGISIRRHVQKIHTLINETKSKTLLDYGCGKGLQYSDENLMSKYGGCPQHIWGILPTLYDPAVPSHDVLPENEFDGVICTDVLEHVPEDSVDFVIEQSLSKSKKFAFYSISTYVGRNKDELLPNGEQPHITVYPRKWWIEKFNNFKKEQQIIQLSFIILEGNSKHVRDIKIT